MRTVIGVDSKVAGIAIAHGAPLGKDNVVEMKKAYGWDPETHFYIPEKVKKFYADIPSRGEKHVEDWSELLTAYSKAHPDLAAEFKHCMNGELNPSWKDLISQKFPTEPLAIRKSNSLVINPLAEKINTFMVGTADLTLSVNLDYNNKVAFNPPDLRTTCGSDSDYTGRYIHFGIREHVMAAKANGLAAYAPNTILPITSSFFMFYLYAAPAVRMGALQHLHVIHVAMHDSIGAGEDGPTHQPIELAAL